MIHFHEYASASAEFLAYATDPIIGPALAVFLARMLWILADAVVDLLPELGE